MKLTKHDGTAVLKEPRLLSKRRIRSRTQIISAVTAALAELPKEEELKAKAAASSSKQDGWDGPRRAMVGLMPSHCTGQGEILPWEVLEMKRQIWNKLIASNCKVDVK